MRYLINTGVRIFYILVLITLIAIAILLFYLSRLEFDDYRHALEQRLGSALQQPVSIGSGALKLSQGLTFELYQIEIGSGADFYLYVPRLRASVALLPLFKKQIILSNVEILEAKATLTFRQNNRVRPQPISLPESTYLTEIRMLTLRHAELEVNSPKSSEQPLLQLSNLHAVIYNWNPQQPSQLVVSGYETGTEANFLLETMLPPLGADNWRDLNLTAKLQVGRFQQQPQLGSAKAALAHSGRLELSIDGAPSKGALLSVSAIQPGSGTLLIQADSIWTSTPETDRLENLKARIFGFPISGYLNFEHSPRRMMKIQLESCDLSLAADGFSGIEQLKEAGLIAGDLDQLLLRLEHQGSETDDAEQPLQLSGKLKLSTIDSPEERPWSIRDLESDLTLEGMDITLSNMLITTGLGDIQVAGQIANMFNRPLFDLRANASPSLEVLAAKFHLPPNLTISGQAPLVLELKGTLDEQVFHLNADLHKSLIEVDRHYQKPRNLPSEIRVTGSIRPRDQIELRNLDIHLEPLHISGKAVLRPWDENPTVAITTSAVDLTSLTTINPRFNRLRLQGTATAEFLMRDHKWQGSILLNNGGAHLTSLIGDLNRVHGKVSINQNGLRFSRLSANLGESIFNVSGVLAGWTDPMLNLEVSAPRVRASDLVFRNPHLTLYDLRGRLQIDRHGIRFDPVSVRLEDATQATVFGSVDNFNRPRTNLTIHGEKANVLDIIDLFSDPSAPAATTSPTPDDQDPVTIDVTVRAGNLGGMRFTNARAIITDHQGVLSVYPLAFESGGGWSRAKVEFNRHDQLFPLKISGHVNGIDAAVIHHDLFDQLGLIRGPLTGDFYLEGNPAGDFFWKHARGGLHFQVHKGTLLRFRGLAQVFSLLNVSQIFSGRLPDMDREGMPFTLMEGSARIRNGVLETDDLKITGEAMNMSLVGNKDLANNTIDMILGVMPLRTVDKVISAIPLAGWVLAGEDRAVLTAYFRIESESGSPSVTAVPVGSISNTLLGLFRRTLGLPEKLIRDIGSLLQPEPAKKTEDKE